MVRYRKYIVLLFSHNHLSKDVADESTNCPELDENSKDVSLRRVDLSKVRNVAVNEASPTKQLGFLANGDKNVSSNELQTPAGVCIRLLIFVFTFFFFLK